MKAMYKVKQPKQVSFNFFHQNFDVSKSMPQNYNFLRNSICLLRSLTFEIYVCKSISGISKVERAVARRSRSSFIGFHLAIYLSASTSNSLRIFFLIL